MSGYIQCGTAMNENKETT